jgi:hypothetical protein
MPGIAASTSDTLSFASLPKTVDAPENNLDSLSTCA